MLISIDPGKNGAAAIKFPSGKVYAYDCPPTQKEMYDLLRELLQSCVIDSGCLSATLEKVHSMPGQGVKSVWTFACNYASWQMALIALGIPFEEVTPQTWMKGRNFPKDKAERKRAIKDAMQKKYPELKVTLKNADALAMLDYKG